MYEYATGAKYLKRGPVDSSALDSGGDSVWLSTALIL